MSCWKHLTASFYMYTYRIMQIRKNKIGMLIFTFVFELYSNLVLVNRSHTSMGSPINTFPQLRLWAHKQSQLGTEFKSSLGANFSFSAHLLLMVRSRTYCSLALPKRNMFYTHQVYYMPYVITYRPILFYLEWR